MYLGVDGGGTKTSFLLIDADGASGRRTQAPGSYYPRDRPGRARDVLADGVNAVLAKAGRRDAEDSISPSSACPPTAKTRR